MRIATYNIWNSEKGAPWRFEQIVDQIIQVKADVICLQEVKDREFHEGIAKKTGYQYHCFHCHDGEEEGLSFLSKYQIVETKYVPCALLAKLETDNKVISIANVHLSWKSALRREREIVEIEKEVSKYAADCRLLLGDFNCSTNSSVHQYLLGQSSMLGCEATPYWYDLAESYADIMGINAGITLDIQNNPRWKEKNTIEVGQRYDRIYLQNTFPHDLPVLKSCAVFGKEISVESGLAPSDHYGVYVDLD